MVGGEPNPLIALFRQCVVRIDDGEGGFRGTGFFVAPGLVATCGHVVHGAGRPRVWWQGREAPASVADAVPPLESVHDARSYPLPDLAVLEVGADGAGWDHPCVLLASGPLVLGGGPAGLYLAGYTKEYGPSPVLTGVTAEFESPVTDGAHTFFKLKRGQLVPGLSGSPLLDVRTQAVAAVAESTRGTGAELGGFAVPAGVLAAVFPTVAAANQEFHASDERWRDAAEAERVLAAERDEMRDRLPLRPVVVELEPGDEVSAATALRPRHAVVGYIGRDQLLDDLAAWCERETTGKVSAELWFVTGGGGFGKTRLAVEACREAEARGWTAGLLPPGAGDNQVRALAKWPGRLLIAVDYAETRPALVGQLVDELAARSPRPPARILLLVRRQAARTDLVRMFNEQREERLGALLRRAPLSRLDDTADEVDRLELFGQALTDFSALPGPPPGQVRPVRLRAAHFVRPLYVLAAAYLTRMSAGADADALSETDLLRELLTEHEALHWERWDKRRGLRLDAEDRRAAVAAATLLTAYGEAEALTVTRLIPHHDHEPEPRLIAIARWLAQLYPPAANGGHLVLSPLEPDRLGEVLVGDVLREHSGLLAAACDAASDRQLAQALTVTGRIAQGDQVIRDQLRAVLDQHLGDFLGRALGIDSSDLLAAVTSAMAISRPVQGASDAANRFPDTLPVWVRPLVTAITALAVEGLRAQAESDPAVVAELARMLSNLGNRLSEMGRREEALAAAEEAIAIWRQLAEASPAARLPDLAISLSNLGSLLSDVGRREEALAAAEEAVAIWRQLAEASPAARLPDLATSLSNLGNRLSDVGRREEALAVAEEAVAIWRQLAEASPAARLPDLATSLSNLGSLLSDVGRREEALAVAEEAVAIWRQLAEASPAAYLPDLATSLSNLGSLLSDVGRREEALAAAEEAVAIRRQLAEASPAAYLPDLATSLNNLSVNLTNAGRLEEALAVDEQAVAIRRQLAEASPAIYLPDLATSLNNLGVSLSDVGRREEALAVAEEAVAIWRQLAEASPAAYLPDLASSLSNLGNRLSDVGRREEALAVAEEAVAIRRQLAEASPAAYLPALATSLSNLGNRLSEMGRREEALAAVQEAVAIRRQLAEASPAAYLPALATSLSNLGNRLSEMGRREEALAAVQEAVAIRRQLAEASPAAYLPALATSLSNLGNRLSEMGRREEALAAAQEAVAIRRQLAEASPAAYLPDLATSLTNFGNLLAGAGRAVEAEQVLREVLGSFEHSPLGTGHILLARGRWLLIQHRLGEAVTDLVIAVGAFSQARDYLMRGQIRQMLCRLRQDDQSAFDTVWGQAQGPLPVWLQHPDTDSDLATIVVAWVRTPDWAASRAYFESHSAALLTDGGEAVLEHLIDANPAAPGLRDHLALLQAARAHGAAAAYDAHADQRLTDRLTQTLDDWVNTRTWDQSQAFATAHASELLDPSAADILDDIARQDLGDYTLRLHRGLLGYAAATGFDTAYALRTDTGRRRAMLARPNAGLPADAWLALARLHSGQSTDDPEAHFQLAAATLQAGIPDEAAAALADCADNAAPFERRDFARRLRELTAGQPQLAAITTELEQILLTARDTPTAGESGDIRAESADDSLADLLAWVDTPTWEESEAFLTSHSQELLTLRGHAALSQLAAVRPGDDRFTLHVNLLQAVLAQGIAAAYAQLRAELEQARHVRMLREWIGLDADPAASAAYLAEHADDLTDPRTIALLAAECDAEPGDARLWQHLGLLLLGDRSADGYAAAATGEPSPFQRSAALLESGDLDQALAWAYLARAADPGPGALLMGQIQTRRGNPERAGEAIATAAGQIDAGRLGEVLDAFARLIAVQPGDPWLHGAHADALQRAGRTYDALAAWDHAISLDQDNASLHFNKAHVLFGLSRFEEAQAELLTVTRLRPGDILGATVFLAAIAWPTDTSQARQHLQAALTSPGERLSPFTRAFYRAIALAGLGQAEDAISELEAAAHSRTRQEASLDNTDTALLNRFRDPPLPGLEPLLQFFETAPADPKAQEQAGRPTETTDPPSLA